MTQPPPKRRFSLRTLGLIAAGVLVCICAALGVAGQSGPARPTPPPAQLVPPAEPSATPAPEVTLAPAPEATRPPTRTPIVAPTMDPALLITPVVSGDGNTQTVDPPHWPCKEGQVKGNRNSNIYHVPGGASYARTFRDVRCFDTPADAEAAGFTAAQN